MPEAEVVSEDPQGGYLVRAEALYMRQGPLPDAAQMEHYERIQPGAANRLIRMAESEVEHRHGMENRGQIIGATLPVLFVAAGIGVFLLTGSWAGVAFAGIGLTPAGYGFLRDVARGRQNKQG